MVSAHEATAPDGLRVLVVVPGGITPHPRLEMIPALYDFIVALSRCCEVTVLSLAGRAESSDTMSSFRLLTTGNRGRIGGRKAAERSMTLLRRGRIAFDVVHSFWLGGASRVADALRRHGPTPWVASVGGQELSSQYLEAFGLPRRLLQQHRYRRILYGADAVTGGSRFVLRDVAAYRPDGRWLPLFPDRGRFDRPAPDPATAGGAFRIVAIADHNAAKDPVAMLRVIALLKARGHAVRLDWIGRELQAGGSMRVAEKLGVEDCVNIHGHVPHHRIPERLAAAHVYLQSSRYESQGVAVCEAAAMALPIVGTHVGLLAEMAPEHALTAPVGGVGELADHLEALLLDPIRRRDLGQAAHAWMSGYSADWSAREALRIYAAIVRTQDRGK